METQRSAIFIRSTDSIIGQIKFSQIIGSHPDVHPRKLLNFYVSYTHIFILGRDDLSLDR